MRTNPHTRRRILSGRTWLAERSPGGPGPADGPEDVQPEDEHAQPGNHDARQRVGPGGLPAPIGDSENPEHHEHNPDNDPDTHGATPPRSLDVMVRAGA